MKSNDIPITRAEEEQFYGKEVTQFEINSALASQLQALDADDCAEVASEQAERLLHLMSTNNDTAIGAIMIIELKALAKRRADIALYGKVQS